MHVEVEVDQLDLDVRNPRHGPVTSQEAALRSLIRDQARTNDSLLVNLALDLHRHGLSPALRFVVMEKPDGRYAVLDGNRRLAALRLLQQPDLLPPGPGASEFAELVSGSGKQPDRVACYVVSARDDADDWLERTHTGQADGRGTVQWSPAAQHRWRPVGRPTQTSRAIDVLDWLKRHVDDENDVQDNIGYVERNATTNLGRLVQTTIVRDLVGFHFEGREIVPDAPEADLVRRLNVVVADLASGRAVTDIARKENREQYIRDLLGADLHGQQPESPQASLLEDDEADEDTSGPGEQHDRGERVDSRSGDEEQDSGSSQDAEPRTPDRRPTPRLFRDVAVDGLHARTQTIFWELRNLDLSRFPNGAAVLLRSAIELSVDEHLDAIGPTPSPDTELAKRIRRSINALKDGTAGGKRFESILTDLDKQYSLVSARNLNQYVHNINNSPLPRDLETISVNYSPLIEGISAAIKARRAN
ncbi:hypothetical protein [Candidatus Poriferisodalis sp.]|uniref:hypothetical protein n=1 Tax=Candidatus Poriferisodalis sp. TaxID=3101277 RepID=UPI003B52AA80